MLSLRFREEYSNAREIGQLCLGRLLFVRLVTPTQRLNAISMLLEQAYDSHVSQAAVSEQDIVRGASSTTYWGMRLTSTLRGERTDPYQSRSRSLD